MASTRTSPVVCLLLCLVFVASGSVPGKAVDSGLKTIDAIIPSSLEVPEGNHVQQVLFGTGVQIYEYNGTAWNLKNVSADLYNFKGFKVGHHFFLGEKDVNGGQASWETFHPYTRVTGKTIASVLEQSDSIAWLLVQTTTNSGKKLFGVTTFVQRLYTQHGNPPTPDYSAKEGDVFNSNYAALYKFSA